MYYRALVVFHLIYYVVFSSTTFLPKYFGELGMTDGQIGMLMSLPAIAGVALQPFWGTLTDRVRLKKYVVIGLLAGLAATSFVLNTLSGFTAMLIGLTVFYILHLPIAPAFAAISLEYTRDIGRTYGPIRLVGTIGYQLGALVIGLVLTGSLHGLFRLIGVVMLLSCAAACFMPPIAGHQHGQQRVSIRALFADRHIVSLLIMVLIGSTTSQYYMSFFGKHLGDLGISNTVTGILLIVSVLMEIPFLIFADKLSRRTSVWNWLLIGFALNAVRWIGLAFVQSVWLLVLVQLPGVSVMTCFEFFPSLYINKRVPDALKGSAQTMLMITAFGISKVIGSLFGGFASDFVGIPVMFGFNGVLLLAAVALLYRPTRALQASDTVTEG